MQSLARETMQGTTKKKPVHRPPLQARVVVANRAVLATFATILAHMAMNKGRGKCRTERGKMNGGSRHGMAKVGRQANSRQMKWPAQALQ